VVAQTPDSEVSGSVAQQVVQPELKANTPNVEVDNNEEDDEDNVDEDNVEDDMDERGLRTVDDESELDDELDDEVDDNEEDDEDGHIEDGELNEGPDDDVEDNVDERNLRIAGFCRHNRVPKDRWGHLDLKKAKKCRRCRDRRDTICHARHKIHGQFCRTQCKKGFHPSVKRTQCLNGRFHPRWWRCLRNHRRRTWQWCPRDHDKGAPFCIHAGTRSRECDPTHCCWKRGRGCLMKHFSSSSSVGAIILWVLLALLLLGAGVFGGGFVLKIKTPKISGEVVVESDDE